jgi:hypothetical protein
VLLLLLLLLLPSASRMAVSAAWERIAAAAASAWLTFLMIVSQKVSRSRMPWGSSTCAVSVPTCHVSNLGSGCMHDVQALINNVRRTVLPHTPTHNAPAHQSPVER